MTKTTEAVTTDERAPTSIDQRFEALRATGHGLYGALRNIVNSDKAALIEIRAICGVPRAALTSDVAQAPVAWRLIVQAIHAVGKEAARRGEMYPQTSDEQVMDRKAERRVAEQIEWYATKGGAVAERLDDWPRYAAPVAPTPETEPDDLVLVAAMGYGTVSLGECPPQAEGDPGIVYLALDTPREIGLDTTDIYPVGSKAPAEKVLAYVTFRNAASVDQTIEVLNDLKVKYFATAQSDAEGKS